MSAMFAPVRPRSFRVSVFASIVAVVLSVAPGVARSTLGEEPALRLEYHGKPGQFYIQRLIMDHVI